MQLHRDPVAINLDLDRHAGGLQLRPMLISSDSVWPAQDSVLLGPTPHGVAWRARRRAAPRAAGRRPRRVAARADLRRGGARPGRGRRPLLQLVLPAAEPPAARRRAAPVRSSCRRSIRPSSVLTVHHDRADQVRVGWHWRYRVGSAVRDEPYWPDYFDDADRDQRGRGGVAQRGHRRPRAARRRVRADDRRPRAGRRHGAARHAMRSRSSRRSCPGSPSSTASRSKRSARRSSTSGSTARPRSSSPTPPPTVTGSTSR